MTCEEFENQFLSDPEVPLPPEARAAAEKHLADCAACRPLARQLERLDATLARAIKAPVLPADFNQRLAGRIQAEGKVLTAAQRAERRCRLQAEYEMGLAKCRKQFFGLASLQQGITSLLLAALAGGLVWAGTPQLTGFLTMHGFSPANQSLFLAGIAAVVFLAIGLAAAFPRKLWHSLSLG